MKTISSTMITGSRCTLGRLPVEGVVTILIRPDFRNPAPFAGDKRKFLLQICFGDITHPVRRELHRQYIRQSA